jgi:hypothetical protein
VVAGDCVVAGAFVVGACVSGASVSSLELEEWWCVCTVVVVVEVVIIVNMPSFKEARFPAESLTWQLSE